MENQVTIQKDNVLDAAYFKTIAEYLYKEKGYPISLNGEIPTYEEVMKDVQIYNVYKKKQLIEKACNWLKEQKEIIGISFQEDFIERFKMEMLNDKIK